MHRVSGGRRPRPPTWPTGSTCCSRPAPPHSPATASPRAGAHPLLPPSPLPRLPAPSPLGPHPA
eukprot:scaffold38409_cov57-Phaeocystis_antarctica.AAC.5